MTHHRKSQQAAAYVRVSTEHQQYSIANQSSAIQNYADQRNLTIVKRFVESGRSGLRLEGRPALRQLLLEVLSPDVSFEHILVYDVSRWGRFQDADESAYYEYMCRQAKARVHYCAEQFENDGGSYASLLKALKRMMAAEFSRELSVKTFAGASRLALMGYRQGGAAGYGLRRALIDSRGKSNRQLRSGERKTLQTDRVILVPGPKSETSTVLQIFDLFVNERKSEQRIADRLNKSKLHPDVKPEWTRQRIHQILTNPKYIGANVYNRKSTKLGQPVKRNSPDQWLYRHGAFEPIVSIDVYNRAQALIRARSEGITNERILDQLRRLLKREKRLTTRIVQEDKEAPCVNTVFRRFGSFVEACKLINYKPERDYRVNGRNRHGRTRYYRTTSLAEEVEIASTSGRLRETFTIPELRNACPGWAPNTYKAFVAHSSRLERTDRGTYRMSRKQM